MITLGTSTLSRFQRGALAQLVSEGHKTRQEMADALGVTKSATCYELARFKEHRGKFTSGTSIEQRPQNVNQRLAFGHWEVDTVISSRGESQSCLVTLVERKTRLLWAIKAPNRNAKTLNTALVKFMGTFGYQVKSITVYHGKEFANYQAIEQGHQIKVYFCHPYSPWERGSNEYFNPRLR